MALPQDNMKQYQGDRLGTSTAINSIVNCFLTLSMDRKNSGGQNWYYYGGDIRAGNSVITMAAGALILPDGTNYIEVDDAGTPSYNAVGFTDGRLPVAIVIVAAGQIITYIDKRAWLAWFNGEGYLKLDQTIPQTVINGVPVFDLGIECNNLSDGQICYSDSNGKIVGESAFKWDYTNDRLKIGNPTNSAGQIYCKVEGDYLQGYFETNVTSTLASRLVGLKSRGTHATPTAVSSGDNLFTIFGGGHDGTAFSTGYGYLTIKAAEAYTTSAHGTQIELVNIISGTTGTTSQPVRVNNAGNLVVGSTTEQTYKFAVVPTRQATAGSTVLIQDQTATTGSTKIVIKSGAGQSTGNLQEWQNISAAVMGSISESELITPATLTIKNSTKLNSFTNSASQSAGTLAYTLPSAYPAVTGYVLSATDAGVMSWVAASGGSYTFTDSVYENAGTVNLLNDSAAPGNDYFYGTDGTGTKGWFALPAGGTSPIIEDATPSFALRRLNESTVGNTRGNYAIDLQYEKSSASMIASAVHSSILGGKNNTNGGLRSVILNGNTNVIGSSITFGGADEPYGGNSILLGGYINTIGNNNRTCFIGGGYGNLIENNTDTTYGAGNHVICGGNLNEIKTPGSPYYSFSHVIAGGQQNKITASSQSVIAGGITNEIYQSYGVISGGQANKIEQTLGHGFIGGGYSNLIGTGGANGYNTLVGGYDNTGGNGGYQFLGGGYQNVSAGEYQTVCGGKSNTTTASTSYNTIGGGLSNALNGSANYSTIPGGYLNSANSSYSFACGSNAHADSANCFVFGDGNSTTSSRTNQALFGVQGGFVIINNAGTFDWYDNGAGVWLSSPNGASYWGSDGNWYTPSSRDIKTNFNYVDKKEILKKVTSFDIEEWEYKEHEGTKHIGIMAQDFNELFGYGNTPESVNSLDICGVLWAAVQELKKELDNLKKNNNLQ